MSAIHILLIDDNKQHCEDLRTMAYNFGKKKGKQVLIEYFTESVEGFEELENESKYKALILDAKGIIEKGEADDYEFLPNALRKLGEINLSKNRIYTPFAVYTGNSNQSEVRLFTREIEETRGKLFAKPNQAEELLQYLLDEIENHPNTKIEIEYPKIYEVFNKNYLNSENRIRLTESLRKLDNSLLIKDDFNSLRKILEAIYEELYNKNLIPSEIYKNLEWTWRYLSGMRVNIGTFEDMDCSLLKPSLFPFHIKQNVKTVEELSSPNSHYNSDDVTSYTYKSAVFALLAVLLWFKDVMEKPK